MAWQDHFNAAGLPQGNYRSIGGYAAESLVIGRAMQCGYNLFFKAWRDSPYDGVLDYGRTLFRIEIKGSRTNSLSVTSGGRTGAQINRQAEDRTHIIDKLEVDFLIGIDNTNGDCFLIPAEILEIFDYYSLSFSKLDLFKEKWNIFHNRTVSGFRITTELIKEGFTKKTITQLRRIVRTMNIQHANGRNNYNVPWVGFHGGVISGLSEKKCLILKIWMEIFSRV